VIEPGQSLGLMIRGGIEYGLGIYVTGVDKESVADHAGLNVKFVSVASLIKRIFRG
jgi:whirlin